MKVSKVAATTARRVFGLCQTDDGHLDEGKMRTAIARIVERKPRNYRGVLFALKRLVRLEVERSRVLVESAAELPEETRAKLESDLKSRHGDGLSFEYKITPELLGGLRVRIGNDVWDGTVKARLDRLSEAF